MDPLVFIFLMIPVAASLPIVAYRLAHGTWPFD